LSPQKLLKFKFEDDNKVGLKIEASRLNSALFFLEISLQEVTVELFRVLLFRLIVINCILRIICFVFLVL